MIRLLTTPQAQSLDLRSQKEHHIPAEQLMENAGIACARVFARAFPDKKLSLGFVCGPGNNSGDGLVMALELTRQGYKNIKVYLLFSPENGSPLFKKQLLKIAANQLINLSQNIDFRNVKDHDIYIDALFGIGLSHPVENPLAAFIHGLNNKRSIISLDLPSGLDGSTGEPQGVPVKAQGTFTFGLPKAGCLIQHGPSLSGRIFTLDIGFPKALAREIANSHFLIRASDVVRKLPDRRALGNKSKYGHIKIWAGREGMWGAAVLSARAAYRVGAGYVSVVTNDKRLAKNLPEALSEKEYSVDPKFTYAVGPGWGVTEQNAERLKLLYDSGAENVILDADAITLLAEYDLPVLPTWILTPHSGEMGRLMNVAAEDVEKDRFGWALKASAKYKCTVLLKGYRTLVARAGRVYVVPTGNAALSKAGSGDVLTGMIAGFRGQKLSASEAAVCASYVHGLIADDWLRNNDIRGLTPSDLLTEIPRLMKALTRGTSKVSMRRTLD